MQPMPSAEPDRQRSTPSPTPPPLLTHADDAVCSSTQGQCDRFDATTDLEAVTTVTASISDASRTSSTVANTDTVTVTVTNTDTTA